jgi:hypothetical protein
LGKLKFPFSKGRVPPADDVLEAVEEVLTVQGADNPSPGDPPPENAPSENALSEVVSPPPKQNAFPEIAPPPRPADAAPPPKTVALGRTKDQFVAIFGQPQKVVFEKGVNNLGAKDIYYYPNMKVTFVNGKVTDVQ